ncbi:MAG TPA: metal ABC transporter substrate-binding protein [Candidatus Cybelea sp.]
MPRLPIIALAAAFALAACAHGASQQTAGESAGGKINVATTISTLNSFVEGVGGEHVTVHNIVPIGASPETFAPTPQDVAGLADAQVLVENGAGLETWLDRLLHDAGRANLRIVDGAARLPVKDQNPHLWMDPVLAKVYVDKIRDALIAVDPVHAADYRLNALRYNDRLDELTAQIQRQVNMLPPSHRYMIVYHNAWQYYNDRFGITTLGFVERNPGQEPNPQQIANLIDLAKRHHVRALFSEPEYSPKILDSMAQSAGIKVVENLYDDSVGTDPRVADYIAMLNYDTNVIVQSLK